MYNHLTFNTLDRSDIGNKLLFIHEVVVLLIEGEKLKVVPVSTIFVNISKPSVLKNCDVC